MPGAPQSTELRTRRGALQRVVGQKIKELRGSLTQDQLAARIENVVLKGGSGTPDQVTSSLTHQKVISKIEGGTHTLTLEVIDVLARALEVDPLAILEPAFRRAPSNAADIMRQRMSELEMRLDAALDEISTTVEANSGSGLGRRAATALVWLGLVSANDLEMAVRLLEALVMQRASEGVASIAGVPDVRKLLEQTRDPSGAAQLFGEMSPGERVSMLAGFFFITRAALSGAARAQARATGAAGAGVRGKRT